MKEKRGETAALASSELMRILLLKDCLLARKLSGERHASFTK
jgi:hypothetical protein